MTADVLAVARTDLTTVGRSIRFWSVAGLFVGVLALMYAVAGVTGQEFSAAEMLGLVGLPIAILVPIVGLVAGTVGATDRPQSTISGRTRDASSSGSTDGASIPPTNGSNVVLGRLLGRATAVTGVIALGFAFAFLSSVVLFGVGSIVAWVGLVVVTVVYGLAFVGIGVGAAIAVDGPSEAATLTAGLYVTLFAFWELLTGGLHTLVHGTTPGEEPATWYLFVQQLNPLQSVAHAASTIVEGDVLPIVFRFGLDTSFEAPASRHVGETPFFLHEWFGVALLVVWIVLPVAIGYRRLAGSDHRGRSIDG